MKSLTPLYPWLPTSFESSVFNDQLQAELCLCISLPMNSWSRTYHMISGVWGHQWVFLELMGAKQVHLQCFGSSSPACILILLLLICLVPWITSVKHSRADAAGTFLPMRRRWVVWPLLPVLFGVFLLERLSDSISHASDRTRACKCSESCLLLDGTPPG